MVRIGIFTNCQRDPDLSVTKQCIHLIRSFSATPVMAEDLAGLVGYEVAPYRSCDLLISLGGDGTFLAMNHLPDVEDLPMIGVNLGSVGFLPSIEKDELEPALQKLCAGAYFIEERMRLYYEAYDDEGERIAKGTALNDVVIQRGASRSILTLDLWINGDEVERVPGDGLIVASPTGSTAYSLSAGGPIVHPKERALLITAICPHTLHNRSYLSGEDAEVRVRVQSSTPGAILAADGQDGALLHQGDVFLVKKSKRPLKMLQLGRDNFYETLAEKIQKRGISK